MGKKITAYKVTNLSKVDTTLYIEGDHFITDRSIGVLVNGKIKTIGNTPPDLGEYAKKEDIPDVSGLAKKEDIPDVSGLAKKEDIPDVSDFITDEDIPDVSNFVTSDEVEQMINDAIKDNGGGEEGA